MSKLEDLLLKTLSDKPLAKSISDCFFQLKVSYLRKDYETCLEKSGKFCELFTRVLQKLAGFSYTPLNEEIHVKRELDRLKSLPKNQLEDTLRITIPTVVECIYVLRNKRGGGHFKKGFPRKHDADLAFEGCSWLLRELLMLENSTDIEDIETLLNQIKIPNSKLNLVEEYDGKFVFASNFTFKEKILLVLSELYPEGAELKNLLSGIKGKESSIRSAIRKLEKDDLIVKFRKGGKTKIKITSKGHNIVQKLYETKLKETS